MKKTIVTGVLAALALSAFAGSAMAADALTLKLKWVPQAQFAGYYVAASKGYYAAENLDVTIDGGSTDVSPVQALVGGTADVVINWAADALASREKGVNLVNIAQPFKNSALLLTCRKDMGIATSADFKGKTLGVWFGGNEYPFYAYMTKLGYATQGGADGVEVLKQGFNVDPLLQKQAACVSAMTYNEYGQVLDGGLTPDDLVTFNYRDEGVGMLEDGLYVLEDKLADPAFKDKLVRFVRASMKGWKDAVENPAEAAQIRRRRPVGRRHPRAPDLHDGRSRQADRSRVQGRPQRRRLQPDGRDPALGLGQRNPDDHQGAGWRLHHRNHRRALGVSRAMD